MTVPTNFEELDALKTKLDSLRPLPAAALRNLHDELVPRWTYNSNAIEGNTLTLMETKVVLEGITVGGKLLCEHFEAVKHRDAILYVGDVVRKAEPLSEWQIRNMHRLVLIDDERVLMAAVLHDIIEDTETITQELTRLFGKDVTDIVLEVTDDKALPKAERTFIAPAVQAARMSAIEEQALATHTGYEAAHFALGRLFEILKTTVPRPPNCLSRL